MEKPSTVLARHAARRQWADLTPEERRAATAAARAKNPSSLGYWAARLDPLGELDENERARQAEAKRSEYFRTMAIERERRRREQREADSVAA